MARLSDYGKAKAAYALVSFFTVFICHNQFALSDSQASPKAVTDMQMIEIACVGPDLVSTITWREWRKGGALCTG